MTRSVWLKRSEGSMAVTVMQLFSRVKPLASDEVRKRMGSLGVASAQVFCGSVVPVLFVTARTIAFLPSSCDSR